MIQFNASAYIHKAHYALNYKQWSDTKSIVMLLNKVYGIYNSNHYQVKPSISKPRGIDLISGAYFSVTYKNQEYHNVSYPQAAISRTNMSLTCGVIKSTHTLTT